MEYNPLATNNVIWTTEQEQVQVDSSAMLTLILEEVRALKDEVQCLRSEISELKSLKGEPEIKLLPTNMPFDNIDDFRQFDERLTMDDDLRGEFKYCLEKSGTKDFVSFIRHALRYVFKDELAVNFTWRGTSEKPSIQNYYISTLIKDICLANFDNASLSDMNRVVQQHFLHANDRLKKRKIILDTNVSSPSSPIATRSETPTPTPPKKIMKIHPKPMPPPIKMEVIANTTVSPKSELLPELPFTLLSDLQEFDDKLLDDRNLKQALKQLFHKVEAKHYAQFVRLSFRAVMTDKLAMELSWRGTKEKPSIQDFTIFVMIRSACHKRFTDVSYQDINKVCQQHFLHARDRVTKKMKHS